MIHLVDRFESDNSRIYRKIDLFFSRLTWFIKSPTTLNNASESVDDQTMLVNQLTIRIELLTNQLKDVNEKVIQLQLAYEYEKARNEKFEGDVAHERAAVADTSLLGLYASLE